MANVAIDINSNLSDEQQLLQKYSSIPQINTGARSHEEKEINENDFYSMEHIIIDKAGTINEGDLISRPCSCGISETETKNRIGRFLNQKQCYKLRAVKKNTVDTNAILKDLNMLIERIRDSDDVDVPHGPCQLYLPMGVVIDKEPATSPTLAGNVKKFDTIKFFISSTLNTRDIDLTETQMTNFLSVKKADIPEVQILKFINHVAHALHWLHRHGIIHKDIRGKNIFVVKNSSNQWMAKLALCGVGSLNKYSKRGRGYYNDADLIDSKNAKTVEFDQNEEDDDDENIDYDRVNQAIQSLRNGKDVASKEVQDKLTEAADVPKTTELFNDQKTRNRYKNEASVYWQPPEIHEKIKNDKLNVEKHFNQETDVYQFGCTMFEMITYGEEPFTNKYDQNEREKYDIKLFSSKSIINSELFTSRKYKLPMATYHQPLLQELMDSCTMYHPLGRPCMKLVADFYMVNILGRNGLSTSNSICQCGKDTRKIGDEHEFGDAKFMYF